MKAISILQPWASLIVTGQKKIETRSWNMQYRGPLLIHASANKKTAIEYTSKEPFYSALKGVIIPLGCIIGKVEVVETFQFGSDRAIEYFTKDISKKDASIEFAFGDFGEGRWGFRFINPIEFKTPISAKGALSIWEYNGEL